MNSVAGNNGAITHHPKLDWAHLKKMPYAVMIAMNSATATMRLNHIPEV